MYPSGNRICVQIKKDHQSPCGLVAPKLVLVSALAGKKTVISAVARRRRWRSESPSSAPRVSSRRRRRGYFLARRPARPLMDCSSDGLKDNSPAWLRAGLAVDWIMTDLLAEAGYPSRGIPLVAGQLDWGPCALLLK